jgi:hypothetical protein
MEINRIAKTCSMYELGGVLNRKYSELSSIGALRLFLSKCGLNNESNTAIIYNSTYGRRSNVIRDLRKLGFIRVTSYKGWACSRNVDVYILKLSAETRDNWFKRTFWWIR